MLDEGVPRSLAPVLREAGAEIFEFPNSWKGLKNGALIAALRSAGFDCLVTCDKSLRHQQNLAKAEIAIVVLPTQKLERLRKQVDEIVQAMKQAKRGESRIVGNS